MHDVKPILFSGPMVRAILEGRKTQTRRVLKPRPQALDVRLAGVSDGRACFTLCEPGGANFTRYIETGYRPGQIRYVREAFARTSVAPLISTIDNPILVYAVADNRCDYGGPWKPSIHMPRWASRLTLEVTEVRVQRLQEISEQDAEAEGIEDQKTGGVAPLWRVYGPSPKPTHGMFGNLSHDRGQFATDARDSFATLWNSINEKRGFGWDVNPWVVAVTFKAHQQNVDDFLKARTS